MFERVRKQRLAQPQCLEVRFHAIHLLAMLRSGLKRLITIVPGLLAMSLSALFSAATSAQQLGGSERPEDAFEKSEFARLFEEHNETHQSGSLKSALPSSSIDDDQSVDSNLDESDATASTWDFYKGLERLSSGTLDHSFFEDAIHARPFIATDRSRGFNDPIAIGTAGDLIEEKDKGKLKPKVNMTVELQADAAFFDQDANNVATVGEIPDGAFFRRSRIGIFGELYETVEYRLEYDFANPARPQFLDNWIALTNIPVINNVIVGHYFEPFSLERYSPNRFITFMERSLADTFAPKRNMGVMVYGNALEKRLTYALGGFRSGSDVYGNDVSFNSGYAGTAHATYLAWYEEIGQDNLKLLHLGGSYSYRSMGDDPIHYSTRPSVRMQQDGVGGVPVFLSTGNLNDASHVQLYGLEAAWVHGPFSIQSELIAAEVHRKQNADPVFHGGYVFGSWFVTGESRSYSPTSILGRFREGIFQRTVPRSNVFDRNSGIGWTGAGAVELAVRWSHIDLNSVGVQGGFMEEMTYGVNWYLNPYTKMMFNYARPTLSDPVFGKSQASSYAMRVQFEF